MGEILTKAAAFVAIIILGYVLRKKGYFKEEDFHVLSKIVLKITLPAAIISNFSGMSLEPSLLLLSLLGMGFGIVYILVAMMITAGKSQDEKAFHVLNMSGYNIGNFTMPFAQSFLGPIGVITTSLFDAGNAVICLGGSGSMAAMIKNGKGRIRLLPILKRLLLSIPFDAYLLMTILSMVHLTLPAPVLAFTGIIANANAFMAMLMMGVGFKLSGERSQIGALIKILGVRYSIAVILSLSCFFLLPLELEYRQALAILCFSPIASAAPAFTADIKGDFGMASAVNSISIVISIVLITGTLLIVL